MSKSPSLSLAKVPCGRWLRKTGSQHHLWPHRSPGHSTCARQDDDRSPRGPRTSERCAYNLCYQMTHGLRNVTQVHSTTPGVWRRPRLAGHATLAQRVCTFETLTDDKRYSVLCVSLCDHAPPGLLL